MANVTDPLTRPVHGTNPQNLIEYITRQKIYDSTFWKEECFGLSAQDVCAKAALRVKCVGGTYGGNGRPTRFLAMVLKMLQIGVDSGGGGEEEEDGPQEEEEDVLEEFLQNEDFKYVRLLGMLYLRLTGRPAEIYERLEPLYADRRRVRRRTATGWDATYVDDFAHALLTEHEICGIALPRLPKRENLREAGWLDDAPRRTALDLDDDDGTTTTEAERAERRLRALADEGRADARSALEERGRRLEERRRRTTSPSPRDDDDDDDDGRRPRRPRSRSRDRGRDDDDDDERRRSDRDRRDRRGYHHHREIRRRDDHDRHRREDRNRDHDRRRRDRDDRSPRPRRDDEHDEHRDRDRGHRRSDDERRRSRGSSSDRRHRSKYALSFKGDDDRSRRRRRDDGARTRDFGENGHDDRSPASKKTESEEKPTTTTTAPPEEGSVEYWNEERKRLGLKPLKG